MDRKGGKLRESGIFGCGQVCRTFERRKCNVLVPNSSTIFRQSRMVEIGVHLGYKKRVRYKCDVLGLQKSAIVGRW